MLTDLLSDIDLGHIPSNTSPCRQGAGQETLLIDASGGTGGLQHSHSCVAQGHCLAEYCYPGGGIYVVFTRLSALQQIQ
jgi:hypothetical protein